MLRVNQATESQKGIADALSGAQGQDRQRYLPPQECVATAMTC